MMQPHEAVGRIYNKFHISYLMNNPEQNLKKCKRCHKSIVSGMICQNCKNELLSNYEASNDWQTAYEIERAQLIALKYQNDDPEEDNGYY